MTRQVLKYAAGSCLMELGDTKVLCAATVEDGVAPWLRGKQSGWVTAEYGMLPAATPERSQRDRQRGRSQEIQRLVGRALRAVVTLESLGERTIYLDCDVLQADGGTRTASITGAYVALMDCLRGLKAKNAIKSIPVSDSVAAVSVGIVMGEEALDLNYEEDSMAAVDMNVAMTGGGRLVEVQGTAEGAPFTREALGRLLDFAAQGIAELTRLQKAALEEGA